MNAQTVPDTCGTSPAMTMARVIIKRQWYDIEFFREHPITPHSA